MLLWIGSAIMAAAVSVLVLRASKRKNRTQQAPAPTALSIHLPLVTNTQTFYAPTLVADNKLLVPLLTNEQAFYSPSVSREEALILSLLTNTQTFYGPVVEQNISVPLLTNTQTFYGPQVSADDRLTLSLLTNTQTFYEPSINQHVIVPLLTNSQEFYGATVLRDTALDVPLLTNTQTFYQAAIRQNISVPRLTNASGFFSITVSQPSQPGAALSTPVVTVTSAAGDPPEAEITMGSDIWAGFYLRIQRSTTGTKNVSDGSYVSPTLNITHQVTPSELAALAITNANLSGDGYSDPSAAWYQQYRWEREDGAISAWSNEITGTVTAIIAAFSTTLKRSSVTLSNSNRTMTGQDFGNNSPQRALVAPALTAATGYIEFTVTEKKASGVISCAIVDSTIAPQTFGHVAQFGKAVGIVSNQGVYDDGVLATTVVSSVAPNATGRTIGFLVHKATNRVWPRTSAGWVGGTPAFNADGTVHASATGGYFIGGTSTLYPAANDSGFGDSWTMNAGQAAFVLGALPANAETRWA